MNELILIVFTDKVITSRNSIFAAIELCDYFGIEKQTENICKLSLQIKSNPVLKHKELCIEVHNLNLKEVLANHGN